MGNNVRPGSCLLPAPGLSSAVATGFLMTLHRMDTGGSKSSNSSTCTGLGSHGLMYSSADRNSDLTAFC